MQRLHLAMGFQKNTQQKKMKKLIHYILMQLQNTEEMIIYWSKIYNLKYISLRLLMFMELDLGL